MRDEGLEEFSVRELALLEMATSSWVDEYTGAADPSEIEAMAMLNVRLREMLGLN